MATLAQHSRRFSLSRLVGDEVAEKQREPRKVEFDRELSSANKGAAFLLFFLSDQNHLNELV